MRAAKSNHSRADSSAHSSADSSHALLTCETCDRLFFDARQAARSSDSAPPSSRVPRSRCACGGSLRNATIAPGLYALELVHASPRAPEGGRGSIPVEDDLGYGESHGYGPGHGGPTGPGDAPATEPPTRVPVDEDERP